MELTKGEWWIPGAVEMADHKPPENPRKRADVERPPEEEDEIWRGNWN
jgi:hypothetical protein